MQRFSRDIILQNKNINVKVLQLEKKLFDGEASKVVLPSINGEMCILPNHISIITSLKIGVIKIYRDDIEKPVFIDVDSGVCSFSNNSAVFIL